VVLGRSQHFWCCWDRWAWLVVARRASWVRTLLVSVVLGVVFSLLLDRCAQIRVLAQALDKALPPLRRANRYFLSELIRALCWSLPVR
jgi:hypothetical protein